MPDTLQELRNRLERITSDLDRYEVESAYLSRERDDVVVAIRVLERLGNPRAPLPKIEIASEVLTTPSSGSSKPPGLPTVANMVHAVLASDDARDGLSPKEIISAVRARYWPDAKSTSLNSIIWRMSQDGRLKAESGRYLLVEPALLPPSEEGGHNADRG